MELVGGIIGVLFLFVLGGMVLLIPASIRIVNQYEKGLVFTLGKYSGEKQAGLNFIVPVFQKMVRVDIRQIAYEIPPQEVMTKDNINLKVGAVVYYQVVDAAKAVINLSNYHMQAISKTQAVLKEIVGTSTMDDVLRDRAGIATQVQQLVEADVDQWGLLIDKILIQQIMLPPEMERAMAQKAVAMKSREATIIQADAEKQAAKSILQVSYAYAQVPAALTLRTLQTLKDISSENNQKTIVFIPNDVFGVSGGGQEGRKVSGADFKTLSAILDSEDLGELSGLLNADAAAAASVTVAPPAAPPV